MLFLIENLLHVQRNLFNFKEQMLERCSQLALLLENLER